jgi:hypothetical protein
MTKSGHHPFISILNASPSSFCGAPHWSAILKEKESGQKYAIDRWPFDQGENPAVVKVEDWYIKDRE